MVMHGNVADQRTTVCDVYFIKSKLSHGFSLAAAMGL